MPYDGSGWDGDAGWELISPSEQTFLQKRIFNHMKSMIRVTLSSASAARRWASIFIGPMLAGVFAFAAIALPAQAGSAAPGDGTASPGSAESPALPSRVLSENQKIEALILNVSQ